MKRPIVAVERQSKLDGETAGATNPHNFVAMHRGARFTASTGLSGWLLGAAENVGMPGNLAQRAMLVFARESGQPFIVPWQRFIDVLRPWGELVITGSGPDGHWYGPGETAPVAALGARAELPPA